MSDAAASTMQDTNAKTQPQNGGKDVALAMEDPDEEEEDDSDDDIDFNLGNSATQVPSAGLPAPSDSLAYAPAHESPVASPPTSAPLPASHSGHLKNSSSKEDGYVNCFFLLSNNICGTESVVAVTWLARVVSPSNFLGAVCQGVMPPWALIGVGHGEDLWLVLEDLVRLGKKTLVQEEQR